MILNELSTIHQHHYPTPDHFCGDTPHLPALYTSHCAAFLPVLNRLQVGYYQLVHDPDAIFLDYEPWIRHMVRVDDVRIAAYLASVRTESTTRRTRNSQRSQWECVRWIQLDEAERDILRRTAFNLDVQADGPTDTILSASL